MHVALLRGINVGGRNRVAMSELRKLCETLGFTSVRTLLQSGNLVFDGMRRSTAALERLLESASEEHFGIAIDYCVRTSAELQTVIDRNPYPRQAESDPGHLLVVFLKQVASPDKVAKLEAAIRGRETLRAEGKHLYVVYPDGVGTSKLTGTLIEKTLGCRGTARNWNTLSRLAGLVAG